MTPRRAALAALILLFAVAPARRARAQALPEPRSELLSGQAEEAAPGKKELFLREKLERAQKRAERVSRGVADRVLSLRNLWTGEVLPLPSGPDPKSETWDLFLRCHHTNQSTSMDHRLLPLLRAAAARFQSRYIEVVSGFRAPKYNLMLRKKGHEVARDSQHTHGQAIDFRVAGVPVKTLRRFVLAHRLGGVGFYPHSQFIHADTGPTRTWTAE